MRFHCVVAKVSKNLEANGAVGLSQLPRSVRKCKSARSMVMTSSCAKLRKSARTLNVGRHPTLSNLILCCFSVMQPGEY